MKVRRHPGSQMWERLVLVGPQRGRGSSRRGRPRHPRSTLSASWPPAGWLRAAGPADGVAAWLPLGLPSFPVGAAFSRSSVGSPTDPGDGLQDAAVVIVAM